MRSASRIASIPIWSAIMRRTRPDGRGDFASPGGSMSRPRGWHGPPYGPLAIFDPRSRALVVADAVLGDMVPHADGRPAFPPTYRYVESYLATISRCEALRPGVLLTAHYPPMPSDAARDFLARSRMFVEEVDEVVLDELDRAGAPGLTLHELLARANPRLGSWPSEGTEVALAFPVVGHLERLLGLGRIKAWRAEDGYRVRSTR